MNEKSNLQETERMREVGLVEENLSEEEYRAATQMTHSEPPPCCGGVCGKEYENVE